MSYKKFILFIVMLLSPPSVIAETQKDWTNLLPLVDLKQHVVSGTWKQSDSGIEVAASENSRIFLPITKSNNYDFKISFTRITGEHSIALIFNHNLESVSFEVDAWGQHLAGIQSVNGKAIKDNETRVDNIKLENGKTYTLEVRVRDNNITGLLDDQLIVDFDKKGKKLLTLDLWKLPNNNMLGIGAYQSNTIFHSIEIRNAPVNQTNKPSQNIFSDKKKVDSSTDELSALDEMSDEFDNVNSINNWLRVFNAEGSNADQLQSIEIKNGTINLIPYTSSWYNDYRGVLVYKPIKGDFIVSTRVKATDIKGNGAPKKLYSLAGIMVRTPKNITPKTWKPGQENYIFLSLGAADKPGQNQFEVKTTMNSNSKLEISSANSSEAEIKILRVGANFVLFKKEHNGNWDVHKRYYRPDMPEILQVGMTVYTDWSNVEKINPRTHNQMTIHDGEPDLKAQFDYFRFRRPDIPGNYKNLNFMSSSDVSNQMILDLVN